MERIQKQNKKQVLVNRGEKPIPWRTDGEEEEQGKGGGRGDGLLAVQGAGATTTTTASEPCPSCQRHHPEYKSFSFVPPDGG